jgi:hypothetical protein
MEFTKDFLKETLENLVEAFEEADLEEEEGYRNLYPEEFSVATGYLINDPGGYYAKTERYSAENVLAIEAIKYPELHPLMVELLEKITDFADNEGPIWEHEEEQAGGSLARELCKFDKKYLPLYFKYIQTNDLDHEVNQNFDIMEVCDVLKCPPEIMPLLLYRSEFGQEASIYSNLAEGICETKEEAQAYLDQMTVYFDDQWSFDEAESTDSEGCQEISDMFSPLFQTLFELSDEQMLKMAMAYINYMAEDEKPTIKQLLKATN